MRESSCYNQLKKKKRNEKLYTWKRRKGIVIGKEEKRGFWGAATVVLFHRWGGAYMGMFTG